MSTRARFFSLVLLKEEKTIKLQQIGRQRGGKRKKKETHKFFLAMQSACCYDYLDCTTLCFEGVAILFYITPCQLAKEP